MAMPMGTIMIAVAVLEIHIERKAAATMNPRMSRRGPPPMRRMMTRAMRRWSPHRSMARAIMKPPMNRKMVLLTYSGAVSRPLRMPSMGNSTMGSRAVANRGMASVIHHAAMSTATAAIRPAVAPSPPGSAPSRTARHSIGPRASPTFWMRVRDDPADDPPMQPLPDHHTAGRWEATSRWW
jgi:hypothetical protein